MKKFVSIVFSLVLCLSLLATVAVGAEAYPLPTKMTDKNGNTLCTYQVNGKTLNINAETRNWYWPFSVSDNVQDQNLILSLEHSETGSAENVVELALSPMVKSGAVDNVVIQGSYVDDYDNQEISLDDAYYFGRDSQGKVTSCKHDGVTFAFKYDTKGRLVSVSGKENLEATDLPDGYDEPQNNSIKFSYNSNGTLKQTSIENYNEISKPSFRLNSSGQIVEMDHGSMHEAPRTYKFTYKNGKLAEEKEKMDGAKNYTSNYTLSYDGQGRLNSVKSDGSTMKLAY